MNINTKQGFEIIRVIKKLGIKEELVEVIKEMSVSQKEKEKMYFKLNLLIRNKYKNYEELSDKEKEEASKDILSDNLELAKELADLQARENELGSNLMFSFIEKLPNAEKELYKCIGEVYNIKPVEVEKQDIKETIDQIIGIAKSESFMAFFKLATK